VTGNGETDETDYGDRCLSVCCCAFEVLTFTPIDSLEFRLQKSRREGTDEGLTHWHLWILPDILD